MTDLSRVLRQRDVRAAALAGGVLAVLTVTAIAARVTLAPAPAAGPAPQVGFLSPSAAAAPTTRLAAGEDPLPAPRRAPAPVPPVAVAVAPDPGPTRLAAGEGEVPIPAPPVRLAALPAPDPGPVSGFVPAPPRRPGPAPAPAAPARRDLATRLAPPPDGPAALDLALGAISPRALLRSPVPPARPRGAALSPAPPVLGPGAILADRLDPPPRRPAAVAHRAAARAGMPAALAPPTLPPAEAVPPPAPLLAGRDASGCGEGLARAIPRRPAGAEGGRAVLAAVSGTGGAIRDAALVRALERGNLPDHLRRLVPVTLAGTMPDGRRTQVTICVMPDYLAVGSDSDFVRVPLGLPAATRIAERFEMILPTARMVDAIHAQARVRLEPAPMTPGAQMASTDYLLAHNGTVERQRRASGAALGHLVSGHKKDLVLTNRLMQVAGRVAIYGWHRGDGRPIQPLSTVHGQHYADYSHGIRLVSRTAFVGGRPVDLLDLLADRRYAAILSGDEGPIATRQILAALR